MIEVARTSETLVHFYQTTRRYNPEDSHFHTHRRENLKSYLNSAEFPCLGKMREMYDKSSDDDDTIIIKGELGGFWRKLLWQSFKCY
jgi:hypothetical protein